jgi:hypothetical protein
MKLFHVTKDLKRYIISIEFSDKKPYLNTLISIGLDSLSPSWIKERVDVTGFIEIFLSKRLSKKEFNMIYKHIKSGIFLLILKSKEGITNEQ